MGDLDGSDFFDETDTKGLAGAGKEAGSSNSIYDLDIDGNVRTGSTGANEAQGGGGGGGGGGSDFISIQRLTAIIADAATTETKTAPTDFTAVSSLAKAFARTISSANTAAGSDDGQSVTRGAEKTSNRIDFTAVGSFVLTRAASHASESCYNSLEIWEYTGPAAGANEFKVQYLDIIQIAAASTSNTAAITVTTPANCVPIILGIGSDQNISNWDLGASTAKILTGPNRVEVRRESSSGIAYVAVAVVEFSGANWNVQQNIEHSFSAAGAIETETATSYTAENSFIFGGFRTAEDAPREHSCLIFPGARTGATTTVKFWTETSGAVTSSNAIAHIVTNASISVEHNNSVDTGLDADAATIPAGTAGVFQDVNYTIPAVGDLATAGLILYATTQYATNQADLPSYSRAGELTTTTNLKVSSGYAGSAGNIAYQIPDFQQLGGGGEIILRRRREAA